MSMFKAIQFCAVVLLLLFVVHGFVGTDTKKLDAAYRTCASTIESYFQSCMKEHLK